jgi:hypothetical protein
MLVWCKLPEDDSKRIEICTYVTYLCNTFYSWNALYNAACTRTWLWTSESVVTDERKVHGSASKYKLDGRASAFIWRWGNWSISHSANSDIYCSSANCWPAAACVKLLGALLTDSARLRHVIRDCLVRLSIDIRIDIETRVSVDISTQIPQQYLHETTISLYVCFIFNIRHSSND